MRTILITGVLVLSAAAALAGQRRASPGAAGRCVLQLDSTGRAGRQLIVGADTNYYAGGGVWLSCLRATVTMVSDSLAFTGPAGRKVAQFIGNVRYRDSTVTMEAERGTYFTAGERWEARGNVRTVNTRTGSTLTGPSLDYYRAVPGRDTVELYAVGRPTISYATRDSAGQPAEPYRVVGDRVRMKGNDRIWAGGRVTIDRSDFQARGDSLQLDAGPAGEGSLFGSPVMRGLGRDSFELTGGRIDLRLENQALTYVLALSDAHAVSRDVDLVADTIGLDLERNQLAQTLAWGRRGRPHATAGDYEIRADSVAFDTPERLLREIRAYRGAWLAGKPDPESAEPEWLRRDWITGDTVVARFTTWDSAGTLRSSVHLIDARGAARAHYRVSEARGGGALPAINYARGRQIIVRMRPEGRRGVERVDIEGQVDGVYLEPLALRPDSAAIADSLRRRRVP
ncbi:MAG TPA: hypothetical protein VNJ71_10555 [Gemmatimonadales bacterium]|nr:hypothetical protein [Gemmatimonadales bacterium]